MSELKPRTKVAVLGPLKTFTHLAAIKYFGNDTDWKPMGPLEVCKAVKRRDVDYGVLAIENISGGFVDSTLDAIYATSDIHVHDEIYLPIEHQLLSTAPSVNEIEVIYSHPQAFTQCRGFLERLKKDGVRFKPIHLTSTVEGAAMIQDKIRDGDNGHQLAVIASREASVEYGIPVLKKNIQDRADNVTRFWLLKLGDTPQPNGHDRSTFLVEIEHEPGTLNSLLNLFADEKANLLTLQTRPIYSHEADGRWEYVFFLEYEGHVKSQLRIPLLQLRKSKLLRNGREPRVIGSYPDRRPGSHTTQVEPVVGQNAAGRTI